MLTLCQVELLFASGFRYRNKCRNILQKPMFRVFHGIDCCSPGDCARSLLTQSQQWYRLTVWIRKYLPQCLASVRFIRGTGQMHAKIYCKSLLYSSIVCGIGMVHWRGATILGNCLWNAAVMAHTSCTVSHDSLMPALPRTLLGLRSPPLPNVQAVRTRHNVRYVPQMQDRRICQPLTKSR